MDEFITCGDLDQKEEKEQISMSKYKESYTYS